MPKIEKTENGPETAMKQWKRDYGIPYGIPAALVTVVTVITAMMIFGSGGSKPDGKPKNLFAAYNTPAAVSGIADSLSQMEGRIVKVQPSELSFGTSGGNSAVGYSHEFEYVMVKGPDGKVHTFIYPYSKAIMEGDASVRYRPLTGGISAREFINIFLQEGDCKDYPANNTFIEAEGVISKGGIKYKM